MRFSFTVLTVVLSIVLLTGAIPFSAFATEPTGEAQNGTPDYTDFRGSGMTADSNGGMVYDDLVF